jgi:hypothetical protein
MKEAAIAPPGVMPSQKPMKDELSKVTPFRQVFPDRQHHAQADAGCVAAQRQTLLHRQQDFTDAKQADDSDQEVDAAQQFGGAEGHTELAGHRIHADAGEQ